MSMQKLLEQFGVAQSEHPESRIELQHNRPTLSVRRLVVGYGGRRRPQRDFREPRSGRVEIRLVNGLDAKTQNERLIAHIRDQGYHVVIGAARHGDAAEVSEDRARDAQGGGVPDR